MKQKARKAAPHLFILSFFVLSLLLSASAWAEKFQSSFSNDYMTQSKQQDIKIAPVQVQKTQATIPPSAPIQQQTAIQTQTIAPALDIPQSSGISTQDIYIPASTLAAPKVPAMTQTRISVPDFEERYKKLLAAQAEAKHKKKKSLIDSILDEIVHYGFLIVLGLVILVVVYALRKDKKTPGTGFQMPQHPEKTSEHEKPKKDIWQDEF